MCVTCGCGSADTNSHHHHDHPGHGHRHSHGRHHSQPEHQSHGEHHSHGQGDSRDARTIDIERDILHENDLLAERNRGYLAAKHILALNLMSSPGSGKTTLLEKTLTDCRSRFDFAVIEGDQQTTRDADRIHATGTPVVQINTGKGCHLDAHMIFHAIEGMSLHDDSVLFIENVGNLVCPALFDLGEEQRVVIISVTEGDDKPLKYPDIFYSATLCIINKLDLLPYVSFDLEKVKANARQVNHRLEFIGLSCTSGEGLETWYHWLGEKLHRRPAPIPLQNTVL